MIPRILLCITFARRRQRELAGGKAGRETVLRDELQRPLGRKRPSGNNNDADLRTAGGDVERMRSPRGSWEGAYFTTEKISVTFLGK